MWVWQGGALLLECEVESHIGIFWDKNCGNWKLQMGCVSAKFLPRLLTPLPQLSVKTPDIRCAPSTLFSEISPSRLFLFPKLKTTLKWRSFQIIEEIQKNAIRELRAITESAFQEAFQQLKKRWERCIASRADYFEGNSAYNAIKWAIKSL
jgi:hypothetical protein